MSEHTPFHAGSSGSVELSSTQTRKLAWFADLVAQWSVYAAVLVLPLFYLSHTADGLEFNKQALLISLAAIGTLAWLGKMLVNRHFEFRHTMMNLLVGVYLVIYAVSAWFSKSRYISFVGDFGQEKSGVATMVCLALLFFVAVNVLRGAKEVRNMMMLVLLGGFIAIVHAYLQALGLRLFSGSAAEQGSFNLVGTSNALGIYAGMILAILMGMFLSPEQGKWQFVKRVLMGALGALALLYVASLSFWALWVTVIVASAVMVTYGMLKTEKVRQVTMLSIPMAAIVIGLVFSFLRFPISFGAPAEVMPSLKASWNIAREALASQPLFGSGPGTFLFDYAQFRSSDLNATAFWSVGFDRSASRLMTLLATTGILGLASYLVMILYLATKTAIRLVRGGNDDWLLTLTVFSAWAALLAGQVLYSSNMTLQFLFWMLSAALVILEWSKWQEAKFDNSPRAALVLSFFFIVAVIFSIAGLYLEGQRYAAERRYADAIQRGLTNVADVDASIEDLSRAAQLSGQNDLYFRTLSQALTLRTNLEVQKVGAKPSDEDARRIALLAANAVNAGKRAADVNPANAQNWSSLASLYSDLAGSTPGAAEAAEAAYMKAIELEPNNPVHHSELGKVHMTLAENARLRAAAKDVKEEDKAAAEKEAGEKLLKAKEQFDKAVELKSDYAPAQYWMAVTLERMGKADEALKKLESVRDFSPRDLGVGFQLAILYYQNEQKDKAIAELERLISISPSYSNARWYLSAMYEEKGNVDAAIAQVEEIQKFNKEDENVKKRLADLVAKKNGVAAPPAEGLPAPVEPPKEGQVVPTKP